MARVMGHKANIKLPVRKQFIITKHICLDQHIFDRSNTKQNSWCTDIKLDLFLKWCMWYLWPYLSYLASFAVQFYLHWDELNVGLSKLPAPEEIVDETSYFENMVEDLEVFFFCCCNKNFSKNQNEIGRKFSIVDYWQMKDGQFTEQCNFHALLFIRRIQWYLIVRWRVPEEPGAIFAGHVDLAGVVELLCEGVRRQKTAQHHERIGVQTRTSGKCRPQFIHVLEIKRNT